MDSTARGGPPTASLAMSEVASVIQRLQRVVKSLQVRDVDFRKLKKFVEQTVRHGFQRIDQSSAGNRTANINWQWNMCFINIHKIQIAIVSMCFCHRNSIVFSSVVGNELATDGPSPQSPG